jgi:hypothetical protein
MDLRKYEPYEGGRVYGGGAPNRGENRGGAPYRASYVREAPYDPYKGASYEYPYRYGRRYG